MRAFIAIPIDEQTTQLLDNRVQTLKSTAWGKQIIWFPPNNYHLTLQFLGAILSLRR